MLIFNRKYRSLQWKDDLLTKNEQKDSNLLFGSIKSCLSTFKVIHNIKPRSQWIKLSQISLCQWILPTLSANATKFPKLPGAKLLIIFRYFLNFQDHVATHTREKSYKCSYCPEEFIWRSNMYAHQKKCHPMEWSEDRKRKSPFVPESWKWTMHNLS